MSSRRWFKLLNPCLIPTKIWSNRTLLQQWTRRLLALRYAGSILGPIWHFITPLVMLAIYTFVFGIVFKARWQMLNPAFDTTGSYAVILFCGMAVFNIFSETIQMSSRCVLDNANLVKKVIFPLEILPVSQLLVSSFNGVIWLALVVVAAFLSGLPLYPVALLFPLAFLPLLALTLGLSWIVAATSVYLRDIPHLTGMALQVLFFMTPIFYPEALVPQGLRFIFVINPLAWLCRQMRSLVLFGVIPPLDELAVTWGLCLSICQLGYLWFSMLKKGFADVL